jgi:hypothetical protein
VARRHKPTDAARAVVARLMPPPGKGRAWADLRPAVGGVLFCASTGSNGGTCRTGSAPGRRCTSGSAAGRKRAAGRPSCGRCRGGPTATAPSTGSLFGAESTNVRRAGPPPQSKKWARAGRRRAAAAAATRRIFQRGCLAVAVLLVAVAADAGICPMPGPSAPPRFPIDRRYRNVRGGSIID